MLIVGVGLWQGTANVLLILVTSLAYALIALGLNIQFGYGGLFNLAVMGLLMMGAMGDQHGLDADQRGVLEFRRTDAAAAGDRGSGGWDDSQSSRYGRSSGWAPMAR